jgi:ethanolamine ammonia-lyase large subunit
MSEEFRFRDLRELFAKANEEKSGDQLAGLAARSERERVAAKCKLADLALTEIIQHPLIDPDEDDVSRLIIETFGEEAFRPIRWSRLSDDCHRFSISEFAPPIKAAG